MPAIGPDKENERENASRKDGQTLMPVSIPSKNGHWEKRLQREAAQPFSHVLLRRAEMMRKAEKSGYAAMVKKTRCNSDTWRPKNPAIAPTKRYAMKRPSDNSRTLTT
jgi:hypothetical protein